MDQVAGTLGAVAGFESQQTGARRPADDPWHNGRPSVLGTLALLAATTAAVFGVALTAEPGSTGLDSQSPAAAGSELDPDALLELGIERAPEVARRVAEIRGIAFEKIPQPQVTDTDALRELAQDEIEKPRVSRSLAAGDASLKLLGLLEPDESLAEVSGDVTASAAAFYDPEEGELFLIGDAVPAGPALTEFVLAHELGHALEDQVYGLPRPSAANDDRVLAESALVEGSATALMAEYAAEHLALPDLLEDSSGIVEETDDLPDIILAQVTFAYISGQRFVEELRASADGGWDLVDFAYQRRLPATSEQILHPEKYLEDEGALTVPAPPGAGPGWEEIDQGAVGEFITREILRQDAEEVGADSAAAGWGGDAYRLFMRNGATSECAETCRENFALVIRWRGDDADEAAELNAALDEYVGRVLHGTASGAGTYELPDAGWATVSGGGDAVSLSLAPERGLARRLASEP